MIVEARLVRLELLDHYDEKKSANSRRTKKSVEDIEKTTT